MDVRARVRVRECMRACIIQSSRRRITYILPFTISYSIVDIPFTIVCYARIPGNESSLVTKNKKLKTPTLLCTMCLRCMSVYNPINVITLSSTSDTCFAIHAFFAVTTCPAYGASCYSRPRLGSFIYQPITWNINGMVHFINTNNECIR